MMGKEEKERGEFELNLELSIGYGKTEDCCKGLEENGEISRSNFWENNDNVCESVDQQTRRREIQALRRQEARRKREERIKKSRGQSGGVFVEDKLFLEAQKLQARAEERESRERDCVWEERDRKKDKSCGNEEEVGGELLSLSLFTDNKMQQQQTDYCLYPKVQQQQHRNGFQYSCGVWAYSSADCDSEHSNGVNDPANGNRSLEQCSSAVSDYHSMSHKGGNSSDTGSHSNSGIPRNLESHDSWSQAETDQVIGAVKLNATSNPHFNLRNSVGISRLESSLDQTRSENPSRETSGSLNDKSPKQATNDNINVAAPIPKMPCVSTTGNGPNGRTITGCLYKYTKMEVSIMCFCHGSSFSPAGFVEHAGGIDIAQPLKHITIVNPR